MNFGIKGMNTRFKDFTNKKKIVQILVLLSFLISSFGYAAREGGRLPIVSRLVDFPNKPIRE